MNYCIDCGEGLKKDAVFCSNCGSKINDKSNGQDSLNNIQAKEKIVSIAKENNYIKFLKKVIKNPSEIIKKDEQVNGWIHLAVITLMSSLSFYFLLKGMISYALNEMSSFFSFGFNNYFPSDLLYSVIYKGFITMGIINILFVFIAYMMVRISSKERTDFTKFLNRFGNLLTPNLLILGVPILLVILMSNEITLILLSVAIIASILLSFFAFNYILSNTVKIKRIDTVYILLIGNITYLISLGILSAFVIYRQLEPMIELYNEFIW